MARVKRGNISRKKHQKVLNIAKGFRGRPSKCYRQAHQAVLHALTHSYRDRINKKRTFRSLWIARLNAALDLKGISYSKFIHELNKACIKLNRKVLSELAISEPSTFEYLLENIK